jgi:hypothetical protein
MTYKSIVMRDVRLDLDGLRLAMDDDGQPRLLDLREVSIQSAVWNEEDATAMLINRAPGLKQGRVTFEEGGRILLTGRIGPLSLLAEVALSLKKAEKEDRLEARLLKIKVAGVSVPGGLLARFGTHTLTLITSVEQNNSWKNARLGTLGKMRRLLKFISTKKICGSTKTSTYKRECWD